MIRNALIYSILAIFTLMAGCVKRDADFCKFGINLQFSYTHNSEYRNLFGNEVNKVNVYVFDNNGLYYKLFTDEGNHLTDDYIMQLLLPEGTYTFVVWGGDLSKYDVGELIGNTFQATLTKGKSKLDNFMIQLKEYTSNEADFEVTDLEDLYFGIKSNSEVVYNNVKLVDIDMIKNTSNLTITVNGINKLKTITSQFKTKADAPDLVFKGISANGAYLHNNTIYANSSTITYAPSKKVTDNNTTVASMKILRLVKDGTVEIKVAETKTNTTLLDEDLIKLILKNPKFKTQEDIDREDKFELTLDITIDSKINIYVNDWIVKEVIPLIQ